MDQADQKILDQLNQQTPHERECGVCHNKWPIEQADLEFFKKLIVPVPTVCPECSMRRKMAWRNERKLYKRKCDVTGKEIISIYSPDKPYKVYDKDYWYSDNWDPLDYGQEYDPDRSFFDQYHDLLHKVPLVSLNSVNNENSEYLNHGSGNKNCYLISVATNNEDCYFGRYLTDCRECVDCMELQKCEGCYETGMGGGNYNCIYLWGATGCSDCHFSIKLDNCQNCILCTNLRNKQYYIRNEQVSKEEFEEFKKNWQWEQMKQEFLRLKDNIIVRFGFFGGSEDCSGDLVFGSKNCTHCFAVNASEGCRYCYDAPMSLKDSYDCHTCGFDSSLLYNCLGTITGYNLKCSFLSGFNGKFVEYSLVCMGCEYVFGSVSLRNKKYCILNKQYSKEDYEELVAQIKLDMINRGEYGQFFPSFLSPFGYNETLASENMPMSKEMAIAQGYKWSDYDPESGYNGPWYKPQDTGVYVDVNKANDLLNGVLRCEVTGKPYRITSPELAFYIKYHIPIPRRSPDQRHVERMSYKNPYRLWKRQCMCEGQGSSGKDQVSSIKDQGLSGECTHGGRCNNMFETTYAPDRPEKVYCADCYQKSLL
ncbi:MAG: hypothetical protein WC570_01895 [Patescibacteria group bacterium]